MQPPRAVIDLGQQNGGNLLRNGFGDFFGGDGAQLVPLLQQPHQTFGHIEIGGKVARIAQDHAAVRAQLDRGGQRLKHLDRQGIPHDDGTFRRPDQAPDHIADPGGLIHPAGLVPAPDQHVTPFVRQHPLHPRTDLLRQGAQRITIEIDHALRQDEFVFPKHV